MITLEITAGGAEKQKPSGQVVVLIPHRITLQVFKHLLGHSWPFYDDSDTIS